MLVCWLAGSNDLGRPCFPGSFPFREPSDCQAACPVKPVTESSKPANHHRAALPADRLRHRVRRGRRRASRRSRGGCPCRRRSCRCSRGLLVGADARGGDPAARPRPRLLRLPAADALGGGVLHVAARVQGEPPADRRCSRSGSCSRRRRPWRSPRARCSPDMPWAVAVALGAIVSPPDAVAAAAIVSRLPVPRRVIVILEGESLVNDASALVLYRIGRRRGGDGRVQLGRVGRALLHRRRRRRADRRCSSAG